MRIESITLETLSSALEVLGIFIDHVGRSCGFVWFPEFVGVVGYPMDDFMMPFLQLFVSCLEAILCILQIIRTVRDGRSVTNHDTMSESPIVQHILAERRRLQEQGLESMPPQFDQEYSTISVRIEKEFHDRLKELSLRSGLSVSQIVRSELRPGVDRALEILWEEDEEIARLEAEDRKRKEVEEDLDALACEVEEHQENRSIPPRIKDSGDE